MCPNKERIYVSAITGDRPHRAAAVVAAVLRPHAGGVAVTRTREPAHDRRDRRGRTLRRGGEAIRAMTLPDRPNFEAIPGQTPVTRAPPCLGGHDAETV